MKSKFEWRVNGFDRMGQAGVHKIGMGVLIGLEEWRTDVTMMMLGWKPPFSEGRIRGKLTLYLVFQ